MGTIKIIGQNLKDFRLKYDYTQDDIGKYLGLDRSAIGHFEIADRDMSMIHLSKLADLFGVEIEDFTQPELIKKQANFAFAFRRDGFDDTDLESMASFNKIVKNYIKMNEIDNIN